MNAISKAQEKAEPIEIEQERAGPVTLPQPVQPRPKKKRNLLRLTLMLVVPLALVAGGAWWWVTGGRYQETDDAYLQQPKVSIASQIAGRVVESSVADNMRVTAGTVLFKVDPEPYRIALAQAEASLEGARLQVEQLRAAYSQAGAQERDAQSEVAYLETQLKRQQDLSKKGVASQSALDEAERNLQKAKESLSASRQAVASALAALGGNPEIETDKHPTVLAALAARDKAAYELQQTSVKAPADGIISQASDFRSGQFVGVGTPLFTLVETQSSWVEANFKETQLTHMKPGQKAEIVFDTYPDRPIEATVEDISAGTGAEFSLLPAQNATGNWVKVTQRIPVRLKLHVDDVDLPLRTGMSAVVTVDTEVAHGIPGLTTAHATE